MNYSYVLHLKCKKEIDKICKKNNILEKSLRKKMKEILENPYHYKPLKYNFSGERRVHIMKSFILKYKIDEERKTIIFLFFGHHDNAYKR
ncbi:MAG: type II toxin-antitoxin system RelE/ParE family toxin [Nanoarchaeota archaeon]|nr:type II toxin-antitoxin system RelE/ParE family toxin [Nanoarchaeota archaeon]